MRRKNDRTFTAPITKAEGKGGWTYVVWPESAIVLGSRGAVKIRGTCDGEPIETSFMSMGGGVQMLPIRGAILRKIGKSVGDTVKIIINERV